MQQQLERLAQWRMAAARTERVRAEQARDRALVAVDDARSDRELTLSQGATPPLVLAGFRAEQVAEIRVEAARVDVEQRRELEQVEVALLQRQRIKTKQWDKLTSLAREVQLEDEAKSQQLAWDEYGARSHAPSVRSRSAAPPGGGDSEVRA